MSLKNFAALACAGIGAFLGVIAIAILTSGEHSLLTIVGGMAALGAVVMILRALFLHLQGAGRKSPRR